MKDQYYQTPERVRKAERRLKYEKHGENERAARHLRYEGNREKEQARKKKPKEKTIDLPNHEASQNNAKETETENINVYTEQGSSTGLHNSPTAAKKKETQGPMTNTEISSNPPRHDWEMEMDHEEMIDDLMMI